MHQSFFFFSSRRRHTRFDCDWSSDVCSSDLERRHAKGRALDTAGKRAAFALFYAPLHFLTVRHVVSALGADRDVPATRSEEHTSELQSQSNLVCRLLLEKKKKQSQ